MAEAQAKDVEMTVLQKREEEGQEEEEEIVVHLASRGRLDSTSRSVTIDQVVDRAGFGRFQRQLICICGLVFMADAMEVMMLSFLQVLIREAWNLDATAEASITAAVFAGELPGALFWGYFGDKVGRRKAFLLSAILTAVFGIASAFSQNLTVLLILRGVVGFSVSGSLIPFDIIAEFTPEDKETQVLLIVQYSWTIGIIFVSALAWVVIEPLGWRWLVLIGSAPLVLAILCVKFLPESPKWLAETGKEEKALAVVKSVAEQNRITDFPNFSVEALRRGTEKSPDHKRSHVSDLFSKSMRRSTLQLFLIWFGFGFSYYGVVLFFPRVFTNPTESGSVLSKFNYTAIISASVAEIFGVTFAVVAINRFGKNYTHSLLYLMGAIFVLFLGTEPNSKTIEILFAMVARASLMGATCMTWAITPSVFPTQIRATGHGLASSIARIGGLGTPYVADSDSLSILDISSVYTLVLCITSIAAFFLRPAIHTADEAQGDKRDKAALGFTMVAVVDANEATSI